MTKRKGPGGVSELHYHLVWCPKYRRNVLGEQVARRLEAALQEKARELSLTVVALEIMPDHVHLFVSAPPDFSPAQIAFRLKGYTSHVLRQEFPSLKSRLPSLWSRSYYVGSAGNVSASAVKKYIEGQKGK